MVVATNWTKPSQIDQMWIQTADKWAESDQDRGIDLRGGLLLFNYYESLFSPNITATLSFLDSGNIGDLGAGGDIQQRSGTVMNTLPIRGNESVRPKISHFSGVLDFDEYPLVVNHIARTSASNLKEIVTLNLVSKFAKVNENRYMQKKYYNNISNNVYQILNQELGIPSNKLIIDKTSNPLEFGGNKKSPFDVILSLGPKSIPEEGAAGYFFYETYDGFHFRAVDRLIRNNSEFVYVADLEAVPSDDPLQESDPNFRVLNYNVVKNENVMSKLQAGVFGSKITQFNFVGQDYFETTYNTSDDGQLPFTLGSESYSDDLFKNNYWDVEENQTSSNEIPAFEWPGSQAQGSGFGGGSSTGDLNNDSKKHVASSAMRYNTLYTQVIDVVVPCNLRLRAGSTAYFKFIKLSSGNLAEGNTDEQLSGKYLILHLSHKFTREANNSSTTHMTILRDTYGLYTPEVG